MDAEFAKSHLKEVRSLRKELAEPLHNPAATDEDKIQATSALQDYRKLLRYSDPDYRQSMRIVSELRKEHFAKKEEVENAFGRDDQFASFQALDKYADPSLNSEKRIKAKKAFLEHADTAFGYSFLTDQVNNLIETAQLREETDTPRFKRYKEIQTEMNERYSGNKLRLYFAFESHGSLNSESIAEKKQKDFMQTMQSAFKKDEQNAVFFEAAEDGAEFNKQFQKVLHKYNSAALANLVVVSDFHNAAFSPESKGEYVNMLLNTNFSPQEIIKLTQQLEETFRTPFNDFYYFQALCKAIDKLSAEGYKINILIENSVKAKPNPEAMELLHGKFEGSLTQFKEAFRELSAHSVTREINIANQLCEEALITQQQGKQENLLVFLGTTHNSLPTILPEYLNGSIKTASSSIEIPDPSHMIIDTLLKYGIDPSEEVWNREYERYRS